MTPHNETIEIYTDGSCHTQLNIGAWAALLLIGDKKIMLSGKEICTTHNRMELTAVIKAIEYVQKNFNKTGALTIVSDSQYVVGLTARKEKLTRLYFATKKGNEIRNASLVKQLLDYTDSLTIQFIKIKAHQKKTDTINYNIEVDKLSRKIVREAVGIEMGDISIEI